MTASLTTTHRRLATVETITEISPIADADAIVKARVRGWDVVVKIGEFQPGDPAVYFEVDSMLDVEDERFAFLAPRGVRTDADGNTGHVLKTARLRGQYSQGLALPLSVFPELADIVQPGDDVTDLLGVRIWSPPIPASLSGRVLGPKPSWFPTTDEERIQNFPGILAASAIWVATEKIDGSSMSVYVDGPAGDAGVCGRNWNLAHVEGNTLWALALRHDLHARIAADSLGQRVAVQGEAYGEGIQGNPLKLRGHHFAAYALHVDGREIPRGDWPEWLRALSVPVHDLPYPATIDEALAQVDGLTSALADRPAEGIVWRAADGATVQMPDGSRARGSWKVVSNRYLLKHDR